MIEQGYAWACNEGAIIPMFFDGLLSGAQWLTPVLDGKVLS